MGALQYISASALSVTLGGNSGVAPFLTLFIVGIIERVDPNQLNMEEWVSKAVASWPSIAVLGALTIVEFIAKCVPCVDAVYESSMVFVAPILSVFGSVSAFGLFNAVPEEQTRTLYAQYNMTDAHFHNDNIGEFNDHRRLAEKSGGLVFLQVMLCFVGVIIAFLVHLFKLLMRVIGEGCCTCCITSVEYTWTVTSVILTILIVPIAIVTAIILIVAAGVGFKKKVLDKRMERRVEEKAKTAAAAAVERSADQTDGEKKKREENVFDAPVDEEIGTKATTEEEAKQQE
eukprot:scaffold3295_cov196-Skeletonema_marinoi.AAC.3